MRRRAPLVVSDTSWLHLDYSDSCSRYAPNAVDAALNAMMLKPQVTQAYGQVTTYLRPKNGAIVERTNEWSQRSWVIARCKSVAARSWSCSKPSHTGLRSSYDLPAIEKCYNRGQIEERTYDWWQRPWVIARGKSVATKSMVMLTI